MFIAIHNAIQQLRTDSAVDVFTVVRQLQIRRPEFINSLVSPINIPVLFVSPINIPVFLVSPFNIPVFNGSPINIPVFNGSTINIPVFY